MSAFGLLVDSERAACVGVRESLLDAGEERPMVGLEPERVMGASGARRLSHGRMAMERVGGDGAALQGYGLERLERRCDFVAAWRMACGSFNLI